MNVAARRLLAVLLLLATAACAARQREGTPSMDDPGNATYVEVENQSWYEITVYVVRSAGNRIRLGQVTSQQTRRFELPGYLVHGATQLSFLVDPVGSGRTARSFDINVIEGDVLQLTVPNIAFDR